MSFQPFSYRITGVAPLLMHNGQLADPTNAVAKEMKKISGKRDKTDADLEELARLEWYGGLYLNQGRPCLPGEVVEATLVAAARKMRRGKQAQAGLLCPENYALDYAGPTALDELWQDPAYRLAVGARVKGSRIMRTRPRFPTWACTLTGSYDEHLLNDREVLDILRRAGEEVGLCD